MFTWKHKYHFYIEGPKLEVGVGGGGGGGVAPKNFTILKKILL